ncbi:MAG: hypothetical protein GKR89_17900 [Candidatus Latescibacteria bacterium]|nr:hypothetical protein [Candidatus Latescibacterota bacterium]
MTHNLVLVVGFCRGRWGKKNLQQLYVKIAFISYCAVFALGALIYPTFRVRVRAEYFDAELPHATGLFEVKEHWAALGLALFIAYFAISRRFDPEVDRGMLGLYSGLCFILYGICVYLLVAGFYLTTLKGV